MTNDRIKSTEIFEQNGTNDPLSTDLYNIFGATQIKIGTKNTPGISPENVAKLVYDLRQKQFRHGVVPIELATGGRDDPDFPGGRINWFPGSETYGLFLQHDAPVYDNDAGQGQPITTILRRRCGSSIEDSSVKILDVLDDINTSNYWKAKMKIYYHVELNNGQLGYINALLIDKIVYRAR